MYKSENVFRLVVGLVYFRERSFPRNETLHFEGKRFVQQAWEDLSQKNLLPPARSVIPVQTVRASVHAKKLGFGDAYSYYYPCLHRG